MNLSLKQAFQDHYTMWFLFAFSVISIAIAAERTIILWRFIERARALVDTVSRCLIRGALDEGRSACERSRSPLAEVFLVGYERLGRSQTAKLEAGVHRERIRVMAQLKNRLWILGTIGATAPFVGLFGTVVGIMEAFGSIPKAEGAVFSVVAPGISAALVATAAGILVAVEAVIIYNYLNARLAKINLEMRMFTDEFLELLDDCEPDRHGASDDSSSDSNDSESKDGHRKAA